MCRSLCHLFNVFQTYYQINDKLDKTCLSTVRFFRTFGIKKIATLLRKSKYTPLNKPH